MVHRRPTDEVSHMDAPIVTPVHQIVLEGDCTARATLTLHGWRA